MGPHSLDATVNCMVRNAMGLDTLEEEGWLSWKSRTLRHDVGSFANMAVHTLDGFSDCATTRELCLARHEVTRGWVDNMRLITSGRVSWRPNEGCE